MHLFNRNNPTINLISYFSLLVIASTTLLSLISSFSRHLLLDLFSHFKLQYLILNALLFGCLLINRQRLFLIIGLFCLSIIATEIVPWYIPQTGMPGNNSANLRILSSNVNIKNQNYSKLLSLVRQEKPDVAVFMEVNQPWLKQLDSLKEILPYSISNDNSDSLGIAVYSKWQLENASINSFGIPTNPSILTNLTINEQVISLIATHPPPPKPGLFEARNQQLSEIGEYIKSLSNPKVIVGDINTTMWSPYYKRLVSNTELRNARQGFGILPTWPRKTNYSPYSKIPSFLLGLLSIPIDHCLISPEIKVVNTRTGANVNADHLPLITDLVIPHRSRVSYAKSRERAFSGV